MTCVQNGATLLVDCLVKQGVEFVFGIPGAKIDAVFDALLDSPIRVIICRHEQNAAFMAAAYGRLTCKPGVVLVTSGPGVSNLVTGMLTATTERDPMIAIGAGVALNMKLKNTHQNVDNIKLMAAVSKAQLEIVSVETIPEIIENAFRIATAPYSGAVFISFPQDLSHAHSTSVALPPAFPIVFGPAAKESILAAAALLHQTKNPVLLLGQESCRADNCAQIRLFIEKTQIPVVSTFQAAGTISRELERYFCGRVGLFKNQPGDKLLAEADLVIAVGYNLVEYDPEQWNATGSKCLINIDYHAADICLAYRPTVELIGDIASTLEQLSIRSDYQSQQNKNLYQDFHKQLLAIIASGNKYTAMPIHPLRFIHDLRFILDDDAIVIGDVGSNYMWLARYYLTFQPHHLLFSNGQQTLGVALPWAISAKLARQNQVVVSISGDGGFLFSSMELETAVREKLHIVHFIWVDGSYDMVKEQQCTKYHRSTAVKLGHVDIIQYASSFGARGYKVNSADQLIPIIRQALAAEGPVLVEIPIDYRDNPALMVI